MTDAEAQEMLNKLTEHFGESVAPASYFCNRVNEWIRIMGEGYAPKVKEMWGEVSLLLYKSNLAHRLIYLGEPVRTEQCPIHKGRWSGCDFTEPCEICRSGYNVTGWKIPEGFNGVDLRPALIPIFAREG